MRTPQIVFQHNELTVIDNFLSNSEAELIASVSKPATGSFYSWNQLYAMEHGNSLPYNHSARQLIEQVQFRCMQFMNTELQLPRIKLEYYGIAASTNQYSYHADNSFPEEEILRDLGSPNNNDPYDFSTCFARENNQWIPGLYPQRYYSTILFLNSNFTGGEEIFPTQEKVVLPRLGRLVVFPSTRQYIHGFRATSNGTRCTLSSWYNKVFTFYDQKKNKETERLSTIKDVVDTVYEKQLLITVT